MSTRLFIKAFDFLINLYSCFYVSLFITDYSFVYKKGISNISGLTGLLLFLLLIRYFLDKQAFPRLFIPGLFRKISTFSDKTLLLIIFTAIFLVISALGIVRHYSLSSNAWDMGIFDQALWNTLHGDILFSSIREDTYLMGDHFEPILFFLVPLYALWAHPVVLIIVQALMLALSVFMLYRIAKDKLNSRFLIFALLISFALSKPLRGIGLSDFHPESFMVLFSFMAFYFLIKKKNLLFLLSVLLLFSCKETAVLIIVGLGIYALFPLRRLKLGIFLIILAIAAWIIETRYIIPLFNVRKTYFYYADLPFGMKYSENIGFIFNHPVQFLRFIFMPEKIEYYLKLLGPVGFIPLLSPAHYPLLILPLSMVILALTKIQHYCQIMSHYPSHALPFIYIAAVYGISNLLRVKKKAGFLIGIYILAMSLFFYSTTDIHKFMRFIEGARLNRAVEKISYLSMLPKDASVSANFSLVPHLSQRKHIYYFYPGDPSISTVDYLILDLNMLGYLPENHLKNVPEFISELPKRGFKKVYSSPDGSFLVFFNTQKKKN